MNEQEWHEWRRQGIGGSDIGVLLGYSQYCTPLELYRLKVGEIQPDPSSALAQLGKDNESSILDWARENYGLGKGVMERNIQITDARNYFMRGNLDGYWVEENWPIDAKYSRSNGWGEEESDQVPVHIYLQMQWYMMLKKSMKSMVIKRDSLTGEFSPYFIKVNDSLVEHIRSVAYHFWHNHVLKKIPPKNAIYTTTEINKKIIKLRKINEKLKPLKKNKEKLQAEIKEFMGNHEFLVSPDSKKITKYTKNTKENFDEKQFKLDYPDLYKQYVTETEQRRLYA